MSAVPERSATYHVLEPIMLGSGEVAMPGTEIALTPGEYLHVMRSSPGSLEPLGVRDSRVRAEAEQRRIAEEARASAEREAAKAQRQAERAMIKAREEAEAKLAAERAAEDEPPKLKRRKGLFGLGGSK